MLLVDLLVAQAGMFSEPHRILGRGFGLIVHGLNPLGHHDLDRFCPRQGNMEHLLHVFDEVFLLAASCVQVHHHLAQGCLVLALSHLGDALLLPEFLKSAFDLGDRPGLGRCLSQSFHGPNEVGLLHSGHGDSQVEAEADHDKVEPLELMQLPHVSVWLSCSVELTVIASERDACQLVAYVFPQFHPNTHLDTNTNDNYYH